MNQEKLAKLQAEVRIGGKVSGCERNTKLSGPHCTVSRTAVFRKHHVYPYSVGLLPKNMLLLCFSNFLNIWKGLKTRLFFSFLVKSQLLTPRCISPPGQRSQKEEGRAQNSNR